MGDCLRRASFQVPGQTYPVTFNAPEGRTFRACDEYTLKKVGHKWLMVWEEW